MKNPEAHNLPFHYDWVIVCTGTLSILACLGFGRFALGMLLPSMGPAVAGMLAEKTGSFSGSFYMAAVFAAGVILLTRFLKQPSKA